MSVSDELKELVQQFRDMGRAEAERTYAEDRDIDLTHIDSRPLRWCSMLYSP